MVIRIKPEKAQYIILVIDLEKLLLSFYSFSTYVHNLFHSYIKYISLLNWLYERAQKEIALVY